MGSVQTTQARKARLAMFELGTKDVDKLHGPVGMDVGARTPPEIAVSVAADLVRVARERETLLRRRPAAQPEPACLLSN
jgi:xanthine dehydrogenase accessory factor